MNLFWKKNNDGSFKEEEGFAFNQNYEISELDQKMSSEVSETKEKNLYHPSPELFRRLIEGTSFDHREKIENKQPPVKIEDQVREIVLPREKPAPVIAEKLSLKKLDQKIPVHPSVNKKKFIKKERENRLGSLVYEVLGHPPIHKQDN